MSKRLLAGGILTPSHHGHLCAGTHMLTDTACSLYVAQATLGRKAPLRDSIGGPSLCTPGTQPLVLGRKV